jgi:hypothetical protein
MEPWADHHKVFKDGRPYSFFPISSKVQISQSAPAVGGYTQAAILCCTQQKLKDLLVTTSSLCTILTQMDETRKKMPMRQLQT